MKLIAKILIGASVRLSLGQTRNNFLTISFYLYICIIHLILEQLQ